MKSADWQSYSAWVEDLRRRKQIPGVAVRVFTDNEILFEQGFGHRHIGNNLPVDADTIFGVASITKSFTALAVLRAASDGLLSLDDPVTRWLPEFTLWQDRTPPTIRHFLNQTSGLPAMATLIQAMAESGKDDPVEASDQVPGAVELRAADTTEEVIAFLNREARVSEPGGVFCYQNDAWGLLGTIVSRATAVPFEQFVELEITARLGMSRTTFDLQRVLADENATMLYALDPDGNLIESPKWHDSSALAGAGFLRSSSRDLTEHVRFLMAGEGDRLNIDDRLLEEMRTPQAWCGQNSSYGYGLIIWPDWHGVTLIGHSGGLKGISSHMGFVPELGVGIVVLTSLEHQPADMIWLAAVNTLLNLPLDTPRYAPETEEVSEADLQSLLAEYRSGEPWGVLRVERRPDGSLVVLEGEEAKSFDAFPVNRSLIAVKGEDQLNYVDVLRDADDSIWGVHAGKRILYRL